MTKELGPLDPLDAATPNYIEFLRMAGPKEALVAVRTFFGTENATVDHFTQHFGVDLGRFPGFYLEVGIADAPEGPLVPGKVRPILVLRQSRSGKSHTPHVMTHAGFTTLDGTRAWIDAKEWDQHVEDTFLDEIKDAERSRRDILEKQLQAEEQKANKDGKEA